MRTLDPTSCKAALMLDGGIPYSEPSALTSKKSDVLQPPSTLNPKAQKASAAPSAFRNNLEEGP